MRSGHQLERSEMGKTSVTQLFQQGDLSHTSANKPAAAHKDHLCPLQRRIPLSRLQHLSNRRHKACTHTHTHYATLLLRPVQEGDLRHKTCSLLWLLMFNIFIYVKASLGRKGLMGSHWMLLTQVSRPHVIACFIIRRIVGESFSDYNFHILLQRAVGDRNDQCSTPNISRWNSCPCWKTSGFSVSAVIMVDYSLLNAPHEISVHAAILADSCCIHLWKEIPWRLLKLRKCLCGFSQWASPY